jgi:hypothetical protein
MVNIGRKTLIKPCAFTVMFHRLGTNKKAPLPLGFWETIFIFIFYFLPYIQNPFVIPYIVFINGVETYMQRNNINRNIYFFFLAFEIILILYISMRSVSRKKIRLVRKFQAVYLNMKSHTNIKHITCKYSKKLKG